MNIRSMIFRCVCCFSLFLHGNESLDKALHDVRLQLWECGSMVLKASYTWNDAVTFIKKDPTAIKGWGADTTRQAYCSLIYHAPWGRIWSLGFLYSLNALFTRDVVIPLFEKNDYILVPFWGEVLENGELSYLLKNAKHPENFYFLGNSDECTEMLRHQGFQAFTVSHNAFIDPDIFRPMHIPRKYDAVFLGECRPQKRLGLASAILPHLFIVTNSLQMEHLDVMDGAKSVIFSPPIEMIPRFLNQSRCGLLLSSSEGGCYASTEYLYCGIPVVSVASQGGRDAYYDEVTAVIVDDTPEAVQKAVQLLCKQARDPWEIRRRALAVSDKMLNTLAYEILLPIFQKYKDIHAKDPRAFVDTKMSESTEIRSKGRTVFQPENPTHNRVKKIQKEQRRKV